MPKYHFQQRADHSVVEDEEGADLPDIETARQYALHAARELLAESIRWNGKAPPDCIAIIDGEGRQGFAGEYQSPDSIICRPVVVLQSITQP
jgi:hypothetical protein